MFSLIAADLQEQHRPNVTDSGTESPATDSGVESPATSAEITQLQHKLQKCITAYEELLKENKKLLKEKKKLEKEKNKLEKNQEDLYALVGMYKIKEEKYHSLLQEHSIKIPEYEEGSDSD